MARNKGNRAPQSGQHFHVHWRVMAFALAVYDAVAIATAYFLGLMLRFDFQYSKILDYYLECELQRTGEDSDCFRNLLRGAYLWDPSLSGKRITC